MIYLKRIFEIIFGWPFLVLLIVITAPLELIWFIPYYIVTGDDYIETHNPLAFGIVSWIGGNGFTWNNNKK